MLPSKAGRTLVVPARCFISWEKPMFSNLWTWIKTNKVPLAAMMVLVGISVAGGCQLFNREAEVPVSMRDAAGGKATVDVAKVDEIAKAYRAKTEAELSRDQIVLQQKIKDANATVERLNSEIEKERLVMVEKADKANLDLEALEASAVQAREWNSQVAEVFWGGFNTATTAASSLPGANLIIPTLTGLIGLFLRKPGDSSLLAQANAKAHAAEMEKKALVVKVDEEWQHGFETGKAVAKVA